MEGPQIAGFCHPHTNTLRTPPTMFEGCANHVVLGCGCTDSGQGQVRGRGAG